MFVAASAFSNFIPGSCSEFATAATVIDASVPTVRTAKAVTRAANGSDRSWRFTPVTTAGQVVFHSAPGKLPLAQAAGLAGITQLQADDGSGKSLALYALDLSK